jgi:hypothetical protein
VAGAARYFAAEANGIGKEGSNQHGTARAHPVLQRRTKKGAVFERAEKPSEQSLETKGKWLNCQLETSVGPKISRTGRDNKEK